MTPMGALFRGLLSGVAGAQVQSLFFKSTGKIAPQNPPDAFQPPEEQQKEEMATATVARRAVEHFAKRGPLAKEQKEKAGQLVHLGFGGLWGGLYALSAESWPVLKKPLGVAAYSTVVWMVGDNIVLPVFKLGAWPHHYPAKVHAYAWAAHLVYGAGLWLAYESLTSGWALLGAATLALRANRRIGRWIPKPVAKAIVPSATFLVRRPFFRSAVTALA